MKNEASTAAKNDPRFTTQNDDGTTTCGNGTIVVTLSTEEFAEIGRYGVFNDAMRMLGNRSEAAILEIEPVAPAEIMGIAREQLIYEYLSEYGHCDITETLKRLHGGHRMGPSMQEDVAKARAYADGILNPITHDDLREWAVEFFRNNQANNSRHDLEYRRQFKIQQLRLGDGRDAAELLAKIAERLERDRKFEHSRRQAIGNTHRGWKIEIVGQMPEQIGLCRYQQEN